MDHREEQTQMSGQGYQANTVSTNTSETIEATAYLAISTTNDRKAMKNITVTNLVLTQELKNNQESLVTALLKIAKLTKTIQYYKGKSGPTGKTQSPSLGKLYYCHSCGSDCPHHSGNCPDPKEGHSKHATALKKYGGNTEAYKVK